MPSKTSVRNRLEKLQVLTGVLPTHREQSETLSSLAESLRSNDVDRAEGASRSQLQSLPMAGDFSLNTAQELYSDGDMYEQLAGFADAGINFFQSDTEFWSSALEDRGSRGANGQVNRVMMQDQRLFLETTRLILKFEEGVSAAEREAVLERHSVTALGNAGLPPDTYRGDASSDASLETCLKLMEEEPVSYAEPDFIEHIGTRHRPSDPEFGQQWHHSNIGSETAWDFATGNGVRMAVIDNGFSTVHPDLRFGAASGYFQQTSDFVDADFVAGLTGMPDTNHGTACAGMIAALADNGFGGCGVAYDADLSMLACLKDQIGTQVSLARAIAYAARPALEGGAEDGVDIIACSLGPNGAVWTMSAVLEDAITFAASHGRAGKGCSVFWACTNGNFPIASDQVCSHPDVIAVGRSAQADVEDGSGFGPKLEFLAPGVDVWIPSMHGGYHSTTGTSFAAPCAAGIGALALSQKPDMTVSELRELLNSTCDKVGNLPYTNGHNIRYGHGRASAASAVSEARRLATGA